jgi:hypothetical protein
MRSIFAAILDVKHQSCHLIYYHPFQNTPGHAIACDAGCELCPEWEYRYYSFDRHWGQGEEMASMRNGCGDDWFLLLDAAGAALKGYAHELADDAELPHNIQAQVPANFASFLQEPAFSMECATFCYWRQTGDVG